MHDEQPWSVQNGAGGKTAGDYCPMKRARGTTTPKPCLTPQPYPTDDTCLPPPNLPEKSTEQQPARVLPHAPRAPALRAPTPPPAHKQPPRLTHRLALSVEGKRCS